MDEEVWGSTRGGEDRTGAKKRQGPVERGKAPATSALQFNDGWVGDSNKAREFPLRQASPPSERRQATTDSASGRKVLSEKSSPEGLKGLCPGFEGSPSPLKKANRGS